jgi:hypothetical protein
LSIDVLNWLECLWARLCESLRGTYVCSSHSRRGFFSSVVGARLAQWSGSPLVVLVWLSSFCGLRWIWWYRIILYFRLVFPKCWIRYGSGSTYPSEPRNRIRKIECVVSILPNPLELRTMQVPTQARHMLFSNAFGDIWNIWQSNTAAAATWNVCRLHHGEKTMCYLNSKVTVLYQTAIQPTNLQR